ncbi:MAG: hypothetical protein ACD_79C00191G0001 [uncultured bacterium]|nr:MAG: hypothetical protein ACD_79C00191G0001 [uncultured bacterium]
MNGYTNEFNRLIDIMERLRQPDGCPWDREQTHMSLIKYLREESFEVIEAILANNPKLLCEELGDLILQVVFHANVAKDNGNFDIEDVLKTINHKLITRHPHVFDEAHIQTQELDEQWESIKKKEKSKCSYKTTPDNINFDPWLEAEKIQLKAQDESFDWENVEDVVKKIKEECDEFLELKNSSDRNKLAEETGDILFSTINLCRFIKMDPSGLIKNANKKFLTRYNKMKEIAGIEEPNIKFKKLPLDTKEKYWVKAKEFIKKNSI